MRTFSWSLINQSKSTQPFVIIIFITFYACILSLYIWHLHVNGNHSSIKHTKENEKLRMESSDEVKKKKKRKQIRAHWWYNEILDTFQINQSHSIQCIDGSTQHSIIHSYTNTHTFIVIFIHSFNSFNSIRM